MNQLRRGLYWLNHDLRLEDNEIFHQVGQQLDELLIVYIFDSAWFRGSSPRHEAPTLGQHRCQFILDSLHALNQRLKAYEQRIVILCGDPLEEIDRLITQHDITHILRSQTVGLHENRQWQTLKQQHPKVQCDQTFTHTLWHYDDLPFALSELPKHFTPFRKQLETLSLRKPLAQPSYLPLALDHTPSTELVLPINHHLPNDSLSENTGWLEGGEPAAHEHIKRYFCSSAPSHYKETRNALEGQTLSSKWSAWLSHGNLSPIQLMQQLKQYEQNHGANDSTYWLFFELLWREYFQWYALAHGKHLFTARGLNKAPVRCCFYPERFKRWSQGATPYPLVNALMNQLNATGFMSNRGRQIAASCLIYDLGIDWRYGAKYFEEKLIDYDVASNWGNWQYIAGVGADPRGGRHFDLAKQTQQYDPKREFIQRWQGDAHADEPLDSLDAADWPIL